jgi:hypothetical protein
MALRETVGTRAGDPLCRSWDWSLSIFFPFWAQCVRRNAGCWVGQFHDEGGWANGIQDGKKGRTSIRWNVLQGGVGALARAYRPI